MRDMAFCDVSKIFDYRDSRGMCGDHACNSVGRIKVIYFVDDLDMLSVLLQLDHAMMVATGNAEPLKAEALQLWVARHNKHLQAYVSSENYYASRLLEYAVFAWRVSLRSKLKAVKQSKVARRFFLERVGWKQWRQQLVVKRLDHKCEDLQRRRQKEFFQSVYLGILGVIR